MTATNTAHLAGEFLVAGELSRRGYPVAITMGNAKTVDIYAESKDETFKVDAKASRLKTSWPVKETSIAGDVFYIFVNLRSIKEINKNLAPEYFVIKGMEIHEKHLIKTWQTMQGIMYSALNKDDYKERWDKLPHP